MKIIPLQEGSFTIDKTKVFVPFNKNTDDLYKRAQGSLLVEVQPFVVITKKDIILIDTGLGFENNGMLQLHENLISKGIQPNDVTKVLLSHLHKDHAGGISKKDGSLSFANAKYYVQQRELDDALQQNSPSYIIEELMPLKDSLQLFALTEDKGLIDDYISYEITAAHSKYHQVFWLKEDDEIIFFGADDAPQLQQMKHKFVAKYDYDGKKCMELRKQWWQQGEYEHWTFLFYHDIKHATIKL